MWIKKVLMLVLADILIVLISYYSDVCMSGRRVFLYFSGSL